MDSDIESNDQSDECPNDCSDDEIEVIEASINLGDETDDSDDDDEDDSDSKSEESDDPGDDFQLLKPVEPVKPVETTAETQMSFEDKANHLHQQFPSFPPVMIKRVLRREDVGEDLDKAIVCLKEMKGINVGEKQEGTSSRGLQEEMPNEASSEPYSLEEKVKCLKREFKTFPPFLIRKVLCRPDVNEDLEKAKTCLQEMGSNKGMANVGPEPNHNNNQNRGGRGRSRGRGGIINPGRRQCWERDISNQNQSQSSNIGNQSQFSNVNNQSQLSNIGNQSQSTNVGNQSQASNMGKQSQSSNTGNQSQSSNRGSNNKRNRRNRNRNRKQNMQPQQNQGTWVGHGNDPYQQHQHGHGYHRMGVNNQMGGSLPYGMYQQHYNVGPQYGSIPPLMGGPQFMVPPYHTQPPHPIHNPPNSRNENFLHGYNQRITRVEGNQERRGPGYQGNKKPPSANSQPLEPSTVVLRGLNENTTFDNIRNFIEARTQESVMDIALSDDKKNAIITLKNISGEQK